MLYPRRPLSCVITQAAAQVIRNKQFFPPKAHIVFQKRKSFTAITIIESEFNKLFLHTAKLQKNSNTHSSPAPVWPRNGRLPHHWQPESPNDMESDQFPASSPSQEQLTEAHTWHRLPVYVKEEGKAAMHPDFAKSCSVPQGGEGEQSKPDADKFR